LNTIAEPGEAIEPPPSLANEDLNTIAEPGEAIEPPSSLSNEDLNTIAEPAEAIEPPPSLSNEDLNSGSVTSASPAPMMMPSFGKPARRNNTTAVATRKVQGWLDSDVIDTSWVSEDGLLRAEEGAKFLLTIFPFSFCNIYIYIHIRSGQLSIKINSVCGVVDWLKKILTLSLSLSVCFLLKTLMSQIYDI
jgi:hypothetical protein